MNKLKGREKYLCDSHDIKDLNDFIKYNLFELYRTPNVGSSTIKNTLLYLVEDKLGKTWMRILWTAMMEKVIEEKGDMYLKN